MKRLFRNSTLVSVLIAGLIFAVPTSTLALTTVASCTSNVNHQNGWIDIRTRQVKQLIDVRADHLTLDSIAARLYADGGQDAQVTVQFKNRDGTRLSILQGGVTVGQNPAWVTFDMPNVAMPRATYWVEIGSFSGQPYWNNTYDGNCIGDSYAVIDGVSDQNIDMGFAVYAVDEGSTSTPSTSTPGTTNQTTPSTTPSTTTPSTTTPSTTTPSATKPGSSQSKPGTPGTSATSPSSNNSGIPTRAEILEMAGMRNRSGASSVFFGILFIFGLLIFFGLILGLIIWALRRRNQPVPSKNKKAPDPKTEV